MRDKTAVWREKVESYYYLFFDDQYYISELERIKTWNYDKELINVVDTVDLRVSTEISVTLGVLLKAATSVYTNVERKTRLFRVWKEEIPSLKHRHSKNYLDDYHNLIGALYEDNTALILEAKELIERKILNVKSQQEYYPPEIQSLAQLFRAVRKTKGQSRDISDYTIKALANQ